MSLLLKRDWVTKWIGLLLTCMNRPGITESRLVLNFQGAPFYTFLQVNAKLGWLNYVSVVFFFASYW